MHSRLRRPVATALLLATASVVLALPVAAHEQRAVGDYTMIVGLIDEPVFTGQKSGLEFSVMSGDEEPVTGLEETLQAQVSYQGQTRDLPLSARFGQAGWYESVFFPTAAGPYTFRIFGSIEGTVIDESFTSGPDTFSEVEDAQSGQFPVVLAPQSEVAADARRGAQAADQVPLALGIGGLGMLIGLIGVGLALAGRRRRPSVD